MLNLKIVFTALTLLFSNISTYASDDILGNEKTGNISNKQPRLLDMPNELTKLPRDILTAHIIPYSNENIIKLNRFFFTLVTGFPHEQIIAEGVRNKPTRKPLSLSIQRTLNFNKLNFEVLETIPSFVWHSLITQVVNLPPQYWLDLQQTNIHNFLHSYDDLSLHGENLNILELVKSIENGPITSFELNQDEINSGDVEALSRLSNLTRLKLLSLDNPDKPLIEARDLHYIAQMTNLEDLHLHLNEVDHPASIGLQQLTSLTKLRKLNLSYSYLKNATLQNLSLLKNLTHLNLDGSDFNDEGLQNLRSLGGLTHLDVSSTSVTEAVYPCVTQLTNLTYLNLNILDYIEDLEVTGISNLAYLTNLTHLDLNSTKIKDIETLNFSYLTNLIYLNISRTCKNKVVDLDLTPLVNLTHLDVGNLNREHQGTIDLARLTKLTHLNISNSDIGNANTLLTSLINLTHLDSRNNSIGDIEVLGLARLPNLTHLDVSENHISNVGALGLTSLINLTHLNAQKNKIEDTGALKLTRLPNLNYLDVSDNDISNTVVQYLKNLNEINIPVKGMRIKSSISSLRRAAPLILRPDYQ